MAILERVKNAVRITVSEKQDEEILDIIDAAKEDLKTAGVKESVAENVDDALVNRAIILYAKGHFGFSDDQNKYLERYENLKNTMASSVLRGGEDTVIAKKKRSRKKCGTAT